MDPVLSSLFPVHQIGADGFNWWIGQVETNRADDPKKSGRYRVRIVGQHLKDCDATPTEQLPWANVMMPVTTPHSDGGVTGATSNLRKGNWVVGFFLDGDQQKPIIMGSVGHTHGSTKAIKEDATPGSTCKSFTTYLDPERNPATDSPKHSPTTAAASSGLEAGSNVTGAAPAASSYADTPDGLPPEILAAFGKNSEANPTGGKFCITIADPNCGAESDLKTGLQKILGDLLGVVSTSGGNVGSYYLNQATGEINSGIQDGKKYINQAARLVTSTIARAKGELLEAMKTGAKQLTDLALYKETRTLPIIPNDINIPAETLASLGATAAAFDAALAAGDTATADVLAEAYVALLEEVSGERGHPPVKKKEARLKEVQEWLDNILKTIGCSIEDITDRILSWLTELLNALISEAYNAALCLVDNVVNGIISEILSAIDELIDTILSAITELLGPIAQAIDIVGNAIAGIMALLGISCSGMPQSCTKLKTVCVDCTNGETEDDFLDNLIASIEDGALDFTEGVCEDATYYPSEPDTTIVFVGGTPAIPDNVMTYSSANIVVAEGSTQEFIVTRTGNIDAASSIKYEITNDTATRGADYDILGSSGILSTASGVLAFAPGDTEKRVNIQAYADSLTEGDETFNFRIIEDHTPDGIVAVFVNQDFVGTITEVTTPTTPVVGGSTPAPGTISPGAGSTPTGAPAAAAAAPIVVPAGTIPSGVTVVAPVIATVPIASSLPALPSYSVVADRISVAETETVTFTITTVNVTPGTSFTYTIDGTNITAADFTDGSLTGTGSINSSGTATVSKTLAVNDDNPGLDLQESFTFTIDDTGAFATVAIVEEIDTTPQYFVTADQSNINGGETVNFTVSTRNVADNTLLSYRLTGTIDASDIVGGSLTGSFRIFSNTATIPIQTTAATTIEDAEALTFLLVGTTADATVTINATTTFDSAAGTILRSYAVTPDKLEYEEGETVVLTVATTNVPDGSVFAYTVFGSGITPNDFVTGTLTGSFTVIDNSAKVYLSISDDREVESDESATFFINGTSAFAGFVILGDRIRRTPPEAPRITPCLSKPIAKALTDDGGRIISIPIVDPGCPYVSPPKVIIGGAGYGAGAFPLLDANGYVTEIRLTRTGFNYKKNTPDDLTCVIDSFTMIRPGTGYTDAPTVLVNGDPNVARAIVQNGQVFSVQVLDRTKSYKQLPEILITGGGGSGAKFLPSLACLDVAELELKDYAKIGTGKYIDCP